MKTRVPIIALVIAGLACTAFAEEPAAAAPPVPKCDHVQHGQFDFWVGEWTVTAKDKVAGQNRIEKILDGCALLENWTGASGHSGKSLNFFDSYRNLWHQTWIDHQGMALYLDGKFADGRMTLSGKQTDPLTAVVTTHRISWTPLPTGEVRQLWDTSTDGKTWTVQFDGLYTRKK
jgi:hypothetical protein